VKKGQSEERREHQTGQKHRKASIFHFPLIYDLCTILIKNAKRAGFGHLKILELRSNLETPQLTGTAAQKQAAEKTEGKRNRSNFVEKISQNLLIYQKNVGEIQFAPGGPGGGVPGRS
jgi:hypothetical protein